MDKEQLEKLQKVFEVLSRRFLTIRPIFGGQEGWEEYHAMNKIHKKITKEKLSDARYRQNVVNFHRLLYAYEQKNPRKTN